LNLRAARRRPVTGDARHPHPQVQAMRKRRGPACGAARISNQKKPSQDVYFPV
jgi:hypothetical protein